MPDTSTYQLPVWAPRVSKLRIQQLYQSDGHGLADDDLINDVGMSLYLRCISMLKVTQSIYGNPPCPVCDTTAQVDAAPHPFVRCANCGWVCPWDQYQKTYQRKGLFAGGLEPFVKDYVHRFATTRLPRERMVLIDGLLHRFHWESDGVISGRPGATSLIEGKMHDVMAFLDRLSYGDSVPPEIEHRREEWRKKWSKNAWSGGRG